MLDWFRTLPPKEDRCFDLFEQHSKRVSAGATSLRVALQEGADKHPWQSGKRFRFWRALIVITPFDRSAITGLISSLDTSINQMQKTCKVISPVQSDAV